MRAGRLIPLAIFLVFGSMVSFPAMGKTAGHRVDDVQQPRPVDQSSVKVGIPEEVFARTERYFQGRRVRGDVGFLLQQGARLRGKRLALEPAQSLLEKKDQYPFSIEYRLWEMRNEVMPRFAVSLPKERGADFNPALSRTLEEKVGFRERAFYQTTYVMRVMSNLMFCQPGDRLDEVVGPPGYEYVSAHQVFALIVLVSRGCQSHENVASRLGFYAVRVRDEFHHNMQYPLSDLQLERAVMLCMISRCDLVPKEFLLAVAKAQDVNGLWYTKDYYTVKGQVFPDHATALAYYLLAMASRR